MTGRAGIFYDGAESAVDFQPNQINLVYGEVGVMGQLLLSGNSEE